MSKLVIVSNRLPYSKEKKEDGSFIWHRSAGGLVSALDPILRQQKGVWLGWDGEYCEQEIETELQDVAELGFDSTAGSYQIKSIPLSETEVEEYYNQFSNSTLWGLFHYFFEKTKIDYASWHTYKKINERFAEYIAEVANQDDVIWLHDFHLFLCPYFLRKINPNFKIHFFLHIPFPHADIFFTLPWQREILESLLCCNSVAFQHKRYLRNFLEVIEIYKQDKKEENIVTLEEKTNTNFFVNPISIDYAKFDMTSRKPEVIKLKEEIREKNSNQKIILGVDRLDFSKGIKERLLAIENLLEHRPDLKETFVYYQLAIPSREDVSAYQELKKEIDELIGRVNGKYSTGSWNPVHYRYTSIPFDELVALYSAADIALVTPLRDGMNLVCKEYVASHSDNDGVLILSKFAGASTQIKNAIRINPYSIEDLAQSIIRALVMPQEERMKRMRRMRRNISQNDIDKWLARSLRAFASSEKEETNV